RDIRWPSSSPRRWGCSGREVTFEDRRPSRAGCRRGGGCMSRRRPELFLFATFLAVSTSPVLAQGPDTPDPGARDARRAAVNASLPQEFGPLCCSILQIPSAAFQNFQTFWSPAAGGYLYPVDPGPSYSWAPVQLPTGVVVTFIDLYYDDTDGSNNID